MDTAVVRSLAGIDGGRGEDEGSGYKGSCMAAEHGGKRRAAAVREKQAEVKLKRQERPKPSARRRRRRPGLPPRLRLLRTLLWGM